MPRNAGHVTHVTAPHPPRASDWGLRKLRWRRSTNVMVTIWFLLIATGLLLAGVIELLDL
ncbi:MAG: hypothetical protein E2O52_03415 [Gammaproteobacteria bacterium]|nr:MAG: hypothetical protein E2O52_03415 [Gammaproteobacteria bacterium]